MDRKKATMGGWGRRALGLPVQRHQENSNPCAGAAAMQVSCLVLASSILQVFDFGYLIPKPRKIWNAGKMGGVTTYQFPMFVCVCVWGGGG
jgi:hypothetical protein